ncbi:MAG: type II secretion system minor pseudopilin GspK [Kangiellaceae bacterium]|nr:type II secretion system minor pseudopilin GspK [Kangiellaceae bacterium]
MVDKKNCQSKGSNRSRATKLGMLEKQRGTVLITVLLVVAFVVLLVVQVNKTVNYQASLNRNLIHRDQAYSYLIGMEELAKIYMKKAFDAETQDNVHLGQAWAQEDITFPIDGGAMVATIRDMQSCFNLNSIAYIDTTSVNTPSTGSGTPVVAQPNPSTKANNSAQGSKTDGEKILTTLLDKILDNTEVQPAAMVAGVKDWIDTDFKPSGPDGVEDLYYQGLEVPYLPPNGPIAHPSELRTVRYFNKESYDKMRPYVCVLPDDKEVTINVNTIPQDKSELLYAALGGKIPQSEVNHLISERPEKGYDMQTFWESISDAAKVSKGLKSRLTDTSRYFQMDAKAEINRTRVYLKTLFVKEDNNQFKVVSRYFGKE